MSLSFQFFFLSFLFMIIKMVYTSEDAMAMEKKSKALACISITKARMAQDTVFIEKLSSSINDHYAVQEGKNKLINLCLVNCYGKITVEQAFQVNLFLNFILKIFKVINAMHSQGDINALTAENKMLLGLEDGQENMNKESFVKDFQEVSEIIKELNKDVLFYKFK
jgi:hypothetical protein